MDKIDDNLAKIQKPLNNDGWHEYEEVTVKQFDWERQTVPEQTIFKIVLFNLDSALSGF